MPKIPKNGGERLAEPTRMSLQEMAAELEILADMAWGLRRRILDLQKVLYTNGLEDRGLIVQDDEIPF